MSEPLRPCSVGRDFGGPARVQLAVDLFLSEVVSFFFDLLAGQSFAFRTCFVSGGSRGFP